MWVFKLDLDSNDVWYFISDNFFDDIKVYNNFNDLLIALGFPRRSVVRVFWIIAMPSFTYWYYDGPPAATRVEVATIVPVQGEVVTTHDPRQGQPEVVTTHDQRQGQSAEESSDDDGSGDDMPSLEEVPCQTPLQTLGSRLRMRSDAIRNAALEAQVAQHRTERAQHRTEQAQHMLLRQDHAALYAVQAHVNARHSTDNREITRMLFITFFFFAVVIVFLMGAVIKLSKPGYMRRDYTNGHA